jgi:type IV pilus assembly protein PilC
MEAAIRRCKELIKDGEGFSKALLLSGCFSEMHSSMISIGYKTSAMDDVMLNISKAYEDETDEKLQRLVSVLEPTLIIILSFFIGLILVSFLLPLLGIMSSIG